jgi:hypothetical protein
MVADELFAPRRLARALGAATAASSVPERAAAR